MTVTQFLIERLQKLGIHHVFGVPGDYVLNFYDQLCRSPITVINTTSEEHAGFAADAYARVSGIGCVCVTYNVGALKLANACACAYAERSPLIVISGSPGMNERKEGMLLHHMVRSFECQKEVFSNWTCDQAVLDNPAKAGFEIDRAIENLKYYRQPIYIEIPRDVAEKTISYDVYQLGTPKAKQSDPDNLKDAIEDSIRFIENSRNPVILAGVELSRYNLGESLIRFAEKNNIPIATTLLSKSVVNERHRLFAGVYMGDASLPEVKSLIDESDCVMMFGVMLTDMTLCFQPKEFYKRQVVDCSLGSDLKIGSRHYRNVLFGDYLKVLFGMGFETKRSFEIPIKESGKFIASNKKITVARLFDKVNSILNENIAIIADVGDALFGASELVMHSKNHFLSPAYYTTMGASIPGALGLQTAIPGARPIVLVGDGAFQMCFSEISTILARGLNPIIIVLNNKGYSTERFLKNGPYNDIKNWRYDMVGTIFDAETINGSVQTEEEFDELLDRAMKSKIAAILNVHLSPDDISPALSRMTSALSKRI